MSNTGKPPVQSVSRREFLAATAATGVGLGVAQSAAAAPQETASLKPENALAKAAPEIYKGTAAGAVVAQLRAAGVRTLFHTNTSGFVPFFEADLRRRRCAGHQHDARRPGGGGGRWLYDGQQEPRLLLRQRRRHFQRAEQYCTTRGKIASRCSSRSRVARVRTGRMPSSRGTTRSDRPNQSHAGRATSVRRRHRDSPPRDQIRVRTAERAGDADVRRRWRTGPGADLPDRSRDDARQVPRAERSHREGRTMAD